MVISEEETNEMEIAADKFLTEINTEFITLQDGIKHEYMIHFSYAINDWLDLMKANDKLFEAIFQRLSWSGSYYDGLKISKPDEYDIMLVMKLPINYDQVDLVNKGIPPSFIKVNMVSLANLKTHPRYQDVYKPMEDWVDKDGFLIQSKFRAWMASVVGKARAKMGPATNCEQYWYTLTESGPAKTIHVTVPQKFSKPGDPRIELDFDLVPVIEFQANSLWPPAPVRKNPFPGSKPPYDNMGWQVFAKPTSKIASEAIKFDNYWRISFYNQEGEIIKDKQNLKPALRMIKKLRDVQELDRIRSYYIKTVFMWEIEKRPSTYWVATPFSTIFVDMLGKLRDAFVAGSLLDYWDQRCNMFTLAAMKQEEIDNIAGRLDRIVRDIESKCEDGYVTVFAKYLLTPEEMMRYNQKVPFQAPAGKFAELKIRN